MVVADDAAPAAPPTRRWRSGAPALAVAGVAVLFVVVGLVQARRDAPAVDEVVDLTAGLVALEHRDLRMNPEHGVLPHIVSAVLPTLLADPVVPAGEAFAEGDWFDYTDDLVRANDAAGRLDDVVFWHRVAPVLLGACVGLLLFHLGRALFGAAAGAVSAALWLTIPYVVGIAHLGTLDVWYAAALVIVALGVLRVLRTGTFEATLVLALAVSGAALVRHQALVLVLVSAVLVAVVHRRRQPILHVAMCLLVPVVAVWAVYRLVDPTPVGGLPGQRFERMVDAAASEGPLQRLVMAAPLPEEWRAGAAYLVLTSEPRPTYVFGQHWEGGRAWYFLASGLAKIPLSSTALIVMGALGWSRVASHRRRHAFATLLVAFGAELVLLHVQPLNLGLRLALPILAMSCVVAGPAVLALRRPAGAAALAALAAVQLIAFARAHPSSLAWAPPPFSDGYRYVSDSSIDIGQATDAVRDRHRTSPLVAASLMLPRGVEGLAGVPSVADVEVNRLVGDIAVSASTLTVLRFEELSWLRAYCPVEVIDDAVLIYRFQTPPDLAPGPSMPNAPCSGPVSTR